MSERQYLFKGKNHPLSNWFTIEQGFAYKREIFYSSEQAYQWEKAKFHYQLKIARKIRKTKDPRKQMRLGRSIESNTNWDTEKRKYMKDILRAKLKSCNQYREELIKSGTKVIIEDTPNQYWGRGDNGEGRNILGVLHSYFRAIIQSSAKVPKQESRH